MTFARNTSIRSATVEHPLQYGFARFSRLLTAEFVLELCQLLMEVRETDSDLWFRIAKVLSQIFTVCDYFSKFGENMLFKIHKTLHMIKILSRSNSNREMLSADTDWNQFYLRICLQHISFTQSIGASQEVFRYRYKYLKMKSEQSEKALIKTMSLIGI